MTTATVLNSPKTNTFSNSRSAPVEAEPAGQGASDQVSLGQDRGQDIGEMMKAWRKPAGGDDPAVSQQAENETQEGSTKADAPEGPDSARGLFSRIGRSLAMGKALKSGEQVDFKNSRGETHQVGARLVSEDENGVKTYELKVGDDTITVEMDPGFDAKDSLIKVADFYSQQPEHLREMLDSVSLNDEPSPQEETRGFAIGGTANNGHIDIWRGEGNLDERVFDHEFAHVVGDEVEDRQAHPIEIRQERESGYERGDAHIPEGWRHAIHQDSRREEGASVTSYGDTNASEDFAETYEEYQAAEEEGPEALAEFRRRYPHRVHILEEILRGNLRYQY